MLLFKNYHYYQYRNTFILKLSFCLGAECGGDVD